jgi:hypothetical protein
MKTIPHLMARAIKADVLQWPPPKVSINPKRKDPLVAASELACARQQPATIDPDGELEGLAIFERDGFRRELRRPVE